MEVQFMQIYEYENVAKIRKGGDPPEMWTPRYSITTTRPQCGEEWKN